MHFHAALIRAYAISKLGIPRHVILYNKLIALPPGKAIEPTLRVLGVREVCKRPKALLLY